MLLKSSRSNEPLGPLELKQPSTINSHTAQQRQTASETGGSRSRVRGAVNEYDGVLGDNRGVSVEISPSGVAQRQPMEWRGMSAEFVRNTRRVRTEIRYRGPRHLLIVHERGIRVEGETRLEGVSSSSMRDVKRKFTFVPAGHDYRSWLEPRVLARSLYVYFDPQDMPIDSSSGDRCVVLAPQLLFDNATLWDLAAKLTTLMETSKTRDVDYCGAIAMVLAHEVVRLKSGDPAIAAPARGGLAAWQQRAVTAYIDAHLTEQIPIAKLAELARLSSFYFCRAFKQSFGMPPHRYHISRRIDRAKALLVENKFSVTEIGLELGFCETSSFSTTFRKMTGLTPTAYHRAQS